MRLQSGHTTLSHIAAQKIHNNETDETDVIIKDHLIKIDVTLNITFSIQHIDFGLLKEAIFVFQNSIFHYEFRK